jgi:UDPglucose 6-dehydrogenase
MLLIGNKIQNRVIEHCTKTLYFNIQILFYLHKKKISIIGSGVVGTATGKGFCKLGHDVYFHDISKSKLLALKEQGYNVEESMKDVISKTEISFICVSASTDDNNGKQDLSHLTSVLHEIAEAIKDSDKYHLLVFRTTLLPGTTRNLIIYYLENNSPAKRGKDYDVSYNPEFLRQNKALDDFIGAYRVVIGEDSERGNYSSYPILKEIYQPITNNIITTSYEAAELIKYASNSFLSLKISFFNEIGMICKKIGVDDKIVNLAVSLDKRIGKYGTRAGRPFGGACLSKDTKAFAAFIKEIQIEPDLLQAALEINKKLSWE